MKPFSKSPYDMFADHRAAILNQARQRAPLTSVPRVPCPSVEAFRESYAKTGTPVVITGAMERWPVMQWKSDDVDKQFGHYVIKTMQAGDIVGGQQAMNAPVGHVLAKNEIRLGDYLRDALHSSKPESLYAANVEFHEGLEAQIPFPTFFPRNAYSRPRFWFAPPGVSSAVHWDVADNLHGVIWGEKSFCIAPPSETMPTQLIHCGLEKGDLLFLPARWWHGATNVLASFAVNFFTSRMVPSVVAGTGGTLVGVVELARRFHDAPMKVFSSRHAFHAHMRLFFDKLADNQQNHALGKISADEAALVETDIVMWALRSLPWRPPGLWARLVSAVS